MYDKIRCRLDKRKENQSVTPALPRRSPGGTWKRDAMLMLVTAHDDSDDEESDEHDDSTKCLAGSAFCKPKSASGPPVQPKPRHTKQAKKGEPRSPVAEGGNQPAFLQGLCQDVQYMMLMEKMFHLPIQVCITFEHITFPTNLDYRNLILSCPLHSQFGLCGTGGRHISQKKSIPL